MSTNTAPSAATHSTAAVTSPTATAAPETTPATASARTMDAVDARPPRSGSSERKGRPAARASAGTGKAAGGPAFAECTVTAVDTAPDLRHATVFASVLGSSRKQRASLLGLDAAHGVLQARLARELRLKRTPQLTFEYDPSVERGVRMNQLIDELAPDDDDADD